MNTLDCPPLPLTLNKLGIISYLKRPNRKIIMTKDRAWPLSDLESGQEILFLIPTDHISYLEGTILGHSPRSFYIEAQGRKHGCNRQHIHPINTDIPSPFTIPPTYTRRTRLLPIHLKTTYTSTMPRSHWEQWNWKKNRPPSVMPYTQTPLSTTLLYPPYTRPSFWFCNPFSGPSETHPSPVSGPSLSAEPCLDQLLAHIAVLNGTLTNNNWRWHTHLQSPHHP